MTRGPPHQHRGCRPALDGQLLDEQRHAVRARCTVELLAHPARRSPCRPRTSVSRMSSNLAPVLEVDARVPMDSGPARHHERLRRPHEGGCRVARSNVDVPGRRTRRAWRRRRCPPGSMRSSVRSGAHARPRSRSRHRPSKQRPLGDEGDPGRGGGPRTAASVGRGGRSIWPCRCACGRQRDRGDREPREPRYGSGGLRDGAAVRRSRRDVGAQVVGVTVRRHRPGIAPAPACPPDGSASWPRTQAVNAVDGMPVQAGQGDDRPAVAHRLASATICATSTPTYGARSVLLTTSRSARVDAGPALAGHVAAAGDVDHEDLGVDQRGREGRGEIVAAGLDQHQVERRVVVLEVLDGQQVGGDVVADRRVRAGAGLDGRIRAGSRTPAERRNRASSSV